MKNQGLNAIMCDFIQTTKGDTIEKSMDAAFAMIDEVLENLRRCITQLEADSEYMEFLVELEKTAQDNDFGDEEWAALLNLPDDDEESCAADGYGVLQEAACAKIGEVRQEFIEDLLTAITDALAGLECLDTDKRADMKERSGLLPSLRWLEQQVQQGAFDEDELMGMAETLHVEYDDEEGPEDENGEDEVIKTTIVLPHIH